MHTFVSIFRRTFFAVILLGFYSPALVVAASSGSEEKSDYCSVAIAGTPIDIINWQGKIDLVKGTNTFAFIKGNALVVTTYVNSISSKFLIPLKELKKEKSLVADFNQSIELKSNSSIFEIISSIESGELLLERNYSNEVVLKIIQWDGAMRELGKVVFLDHLDKNTKIVYQDANLNLNLIDSKLGTPTPYFNNLVKTNISKFVGPGIFLKNDRILFLTQLPCEKCEINVALIDVKNNKITYTSGKIGELPNKFVLKSNEVIELSNQATAIWQLADNYISYSNLSSKKTYPVIFNSQINNKSNLSFQYSESNRLIVKTNSLNQLFLIDAEKVDCMSSIKIQEGTEIFLKSKINGQTSCDGKKSALQDWDQVNHRKYDEVISKSTLSFEDVDYLLQRYLRSIELSDRDIYLIEMIYQMPISSHFGDLLSMIIDKSENNNNLRKLLLIKRFKDEKKFTGKLENICLDSISKAEISANYKKKILNKIDSESHTYSPVNYQKLLFIKSYLSVLTNEDKEELADKIGTKLATAIQEHDFYLKNIFFSTLDWFSTQKAREFLGLKAISLTDLVITQNDTHVAILGTKELLSDGEFSNSDLKRNKGGFYSFDPIFISLYDEGSKTYSWFHGDEKFEGVVTFEKRKVDFVPTLVEGPNKSELLDDKIYHGVIAIGSNINLSTMEQIKNNYLFYLRQQNFVIDSPMLIEDSFGYIKDGISGKKQKIDFFVKEAHTDGDYRNLFSVNKKMFLIRATLEHSDYKEVIDLLYHDGSYNAEYITNKQFGEWLKIRENEKLGGQFIFLNTSCNSYLKAAAELGNAESKILVDIPSYTSVATFSTRANNSTYHLFDGIRKMLTFADIAKTIKDMDGKYLFPMDDLYKEHVVKNINSGFIVHSKIFKIDENGQPKPYEIEQVLNQSSRAF